MNIVITTPTLKNPHGGTRVLNEWARLLDERGHSITLLVQSGNTGCNWYEIPKTINVTTDPLVVKKAECTIIGSPHSIHLQKLVQNSKKCFVYMQMLEHMFAPNNRAFQLQCREFYTTPHPMFYGSQWNLDFLHKRLRRKGRNYMVGNGTNLTHFPVEKVEKGNVILVEGWEATNPVKDVLKIGPRVAKHLKEEGYTILAYSQKPLTTMPDVPDEYYCQPSLEVMNDLYRRAKILIKATKYDNRSTAPLEAMTKGTPTVRGIIEGDDDLQDGYNCLKGGYDEYEVYTMAKKLLSNDSKYDYIANNCLSYVQEYNWDYWMNKVEDVICSDD